MHTELNDIIVRFETGWGHADWLDITLVCSVV